MTRSRGSVERTIPAHPYRDSALVYAAMAIALVTIAALTGGDVVRAALVAALFFLVATAWSWWRFRIRIKQRTALATPDGQDDHHPNENGAGGGNE